MNQHEEELKKQERITNSTGMTALASFYYDRPAYRQEQAVDGWKKIWAFLEKKQGTEVGYIVERGDTERSVTMCTMITTQAKVEGSGQGASGWFELK